MMRRRAFVATAAAVVATAPFAAKAQLQRLRKVAYLAPFPAGDIRSQAFREGLRQYGMIEGRDVTVEYFLARDIAGLPVQADLAVASRPDVIVALTSQAVVAVRDRARTIPIVMAAVNDPVSSGLVNGLARPGGTTTGVSLMATETTPRRLQFFSDLVGGFFRIAVFSNPQIPPTEFAKREALNAAATLGIDAVSVEAVTFDEISAQIPELVAKGASGVFFVSDQNVSNNIKAIADLALKYNLPATYDFRIFPEVGGLMSYGVSLPAHYRRAAYYVGRILAGARPADLPVEQPREFEFVINKRTADMLGIKIPEALSVFATEIIE
jgi:putative ABC transport system substrate-binding protein